MKIKRTTKEMVEELEKNFLYEAQHIPIYFRGFSENEKYFWGVELATFVEDGKKIYEDEGAIFCYSTIRALEEMVKDIDNNSIRTTMYGDNINEARDSFQVNIDSYRFLLSEFKMKRRIYVINK